MIAENNFSGKNLKDSTSAVSYPVKDTTPITLSYNKFDKLIIALYMVTDILEKDEPLRHKLRTLGTEIISDIHSIIQNNRGNIERPQGKITEVISFLEIASAINLISEMNSNVLKKEFLALAQSIREYGQVKSVWLEDILIDSPETQIEQIPELNKKKSLIGHGKPTKIVTTTTRLGVQKGSTLMQALSDRNLVQSINKQNLDTNNFDILKDKRRKDILAIIKDNKQGLTITDIKTIAKGLNIPPMSIMTCSEKTLQRELISMVRDGILSKRGEKRWSRYFILTLTIPRLQSL